MPRCPDAQLDTGHRTPTPDSGQPDAWTPPPDTGHRSRGHRTRGHWTLTPDTGRRMLLRTGQADKARPAPDILGHHAERLPAGTPYRAPADGACGVRRPMQRLGGEATCQYAKLPIALSAAARSLRRPSGASAHCSPQTITGRDWAAYWLPSEAVLKEWLRQRRAGRRPNEVRAPIRSPENLPPPSIYGGGSPNSAA
jgi:hypothetical protein